MNSLLRSSALFLILAGCSASDDWATPSGSTIAPRATYAFAQWCQDQGLQGCHTAPLNLPLAQWQAGLGILSEIVASPSRIAVRRQDFQSPSIRNLFLLAGMENLALFLDQLPWENLTLGRGKILLQTTPQGGSTTVDGLTLKGAPELSLTFSDSYTLEISGPSLTTPKGYQSTVQRLSLADPNSIQVMLEGDTLSQMPLSFFTGIPQRKDSKLSFPSLLSALAEITLDPSLNWRKNIQITLTEPSLKAICAKALPLMEDTTFQPVVDAFAQYGKSLVIGGETSLVASLSLKTPLHCTMKVQNIPILGSVDLSIDFGQGFGLSSIARMPSKRARSKIYGIQTNFGTVDYLETKGTEAWLNVGSFTIPIKGEGSTETIRCQPNGPS